MSLHWPARYEESWTMSCLGGCERRTRSGASEKPDEAAGGGSYSPRDDCTTGEGARDVTLSSSERRSCTWTPANLHKYIVFILPLLFGLKEKNKQWDNQVKMGVLHACSHIAFFIGLSLDETFCSSKRDTIYCFYLIPICCVFDCSFFFFALANHLFPRHCSNTQTTREIASPSSKPW